MTEDDALVTEREVNVIASRVVRYICPSNTSDAAVGILVEDLSADIVNAICNWMCRPHPLISE